MAEPRIIKKYPNRRLYDTEVSAYITLEEVRDLVHRNIPIRVVDSKTGEELTRAILLQIISEEEDRGGTPVLTVSLMEQIIRFYGDTLQVQGTLPGYLEKSMSFFTEQQDTLRRQMASNLSTLANPFAISTRIRETNLTLLEAWRQFFWNSGSRGGDADSDEGKGKE